MRASPESTTCRIPGTVSEVSATLVARYHAPLRVPLENPRLIGGREPRVER